MSAPSAIKFCVSLTHVLEVPPFHFASLWHLHFHATPLGYPGAKIRGRERERTRMDLSDRGMCPSKECTWFQRGCRGFTIQVMCWLWELKNACSWKALSSINWKNISYCGPFAKGSNSHEQAPLSSFANPCELYCHSAFGFRMKRKPGAPEKPEDYQPSHI